MSDPFKTPDNPAATDPPPITHRPAPAYHDPFEGSKTVTVVHHHPAATAPPPPPPPPKTQENKPIFLSGYGGLSMRASSVNRKLGMLIGVQGGIMIGQRLSLGGALYKLTKRYGEPIRDGDGNALALKMAYGGATMGLTIIRRGRFELAANGLLGAGVGCISSDFNYDKDELGCIESVKMFVGEPEAAMYIYATDWLRFGVNAGYRFVVRERWSEPHNFLLSGGYGGLNVEFGWFKRGDTGKR